ncbi:hypothetical protein HK101_005126, partial [Irineochytrium annulatum]
MGLKDRIIEVGGALRHGGRWEMESWSGEMESWSREMWSADGDAGQWSEAQIERERWFIKDVPFSRWMLFPAALLIQLGCGSLYAFSGYGDVTYDIAIVTDKTDAVNIFYFTLAVFGCSAALLGPWMERAGPRRVALLGTALFFAGNLIVALGVAVEQIAIIYIGYGLVGGMGLGLAYIASISPLQKWFPDHRGLAAGVARALLRLDTKPQSVFVILGTGYLVLMAVGSIILRTPPPGYTVNGINIDTIRGAENRSGLLKGKNARTATDAVDISVGATDADVLLPGMTLWESLKSTEFILMYFMFFCSQITGLLILSRINQMTIDNFYFFARKNDLVNRVLYGLDLLNGLLSGSDLLGRLSVPFISDLIKSRKSLLVTSAVCQLAVLASLPAATNAGPTHGVILTAWAGAGVCGGLVYERVNKTYWYYANFHWILAFTAVGVVLAWAVPADIRDRRLAKVEGEWVRVR